TLDPLLVSFQACPLLPAARLEEPHLAVLPQDPAARRQRRSVGRKVQPQDVPRLAGDLQQLLARLHVPQLDLARRPTPRWPLARRHDLPIWRERNALHPLRVHGLDGPSRLERGGVPEAHGGVEARRGEGLAIRRVDGSSHRSLVVRQRRLLLAGRHVPDLDGTVPRGREQPLAVRRENDAEDEALVAVERRRLLAGCQVPQFDLARLRWPRILAGTRGERLAIGGEGGGPDALGMPAQHDAFLAGWPVVNADRFVLAGQ